MGLKYQWKLDLGENMVKGARAPKVKVIFQGLLMTCVVFVLVSNIQNLIYSLALPNVAYKELVFLLVSIPFTKNVMEQNLVGFPNSMSL
jgi:hypothetical protein